MNNSVAARDTFADKVTRGIFKPVGRHLRDDIRDDRLARREADLPLLA